MINDKVDQIYTEYQVVYILEPKIEYESKLFLEI